MQCGHNNRKIAPFSSKLHEFQIYFGIFYSIKQEISRFIYIFHRRNLSFRTTKIRNASPTNQQTSIGRSYSNQKTLHKQTAHSQSNRRTTTRALLPYTMTATLISFTLSSLTVYVITNTILECLRESFVYCYSESRGCSLVLLMLKKLFLVISKGETIWFLAIL